VTDHPFLVVAPSYQWFVSWCQDKKIHPRDKTKAIYIRDLGDVQGRQVMNKEQIIDLGPFDRKRYELVLALASRIRER
jgi:hypothetical protein